MFIQEAESPLFSTTLIEAVCLNSGCDEEEKLSPYSTLLSGFQGYLRNNRLWKASKVDPRLLLASQPDYDADKQMPEIEKTYYGRNVAEYAYTGATKTFGICNPNQTLHHARRLEDIDSSWINHYCSNLNMSLNYHDDSLLRRYVREWKTMRVAIDPEDGDVVTENEMRVETETDILQSTEIEHDVLDYVARVLPYSFRKLRLYNPIFRTVNVFSVVRAVAAVREFNKKKDASQYYACKKSYAPRNLLTAGIYIGYDDKMYALGDNANASNRDFQMIKDWLNNGDWSRDIGLQLIDTIIYCYERLNVDIKYEDVRWYTDENFFDRLPLSYIITNKEYIRDAKVARGEVIVEDTVGNIQLVTANIVSLRNKLQQLGTLTTWTADMFEDGAEQSIGYLLSRGFGTDTTSIPREDLECVDGIYYNYVTGLPVAFNFDNIFAEKLLRKVRSVSTNHYWYMTSYGVLILDGFNDCAYALIVTQVNTCVNQGGVLGIDSLRQIQLSSD